MGEPSVNPTAIFRFQSLVRLSSRSADLRSGTPFKPLRAPAENRRQRCDLEPALPKQRLPTKP
jgi:hypothetical protein